MKKLFSLIFVMAMCLSAHAQTTLQNQEEEDTTVAVIGYFCKNDSMTYRRVQGKEKIVDNDTTIMNEITEEFMVIVTDSTSDGYKMELIPLSMEIKGSAKDENTLLAQQLWPEIKDLRCRFTTDEYGTVQHIENWREIRDVLKKSYVRVLDTLYAHNPAMDSIMPHKQLESLLLLGSSTEDGIKEQYSELDRLFKHHGLEFNINPVESDDVSEQGYPTHTKLESFYSTKEDEYDTDGDYVVLAKTDTKISADDMKDIIGITLGVLFTSELADSVNKYVVEALKESNEDMTITNYELHSYSFNGWPKLTQTVTEINFGNIAKRIEYDTIEWTSRRWGVFTFPEEEDEKEKDI